MMHGYTAVCNAVHACIHLALLNDVLEHTDKLPYIAGVISYYEVAVYHQSYYNICNIA